MPWNYLLAFAMLLAGLLLIGCGTTVCWKRWRCWRCKSVDDLRREDADRRSKRPAA